MYKITDYSKEKAKELNVIIKSSTRKNKKIDVYDSNLKYITSVGDIRYSDYPNYIKTHGLEYANKRRQLFHIRHKNNNSKKAYYSKNILW